MDLATAKSQAEEVLRPLVGNMITTELLNDIENKVNDLIWIWLEEHNFLVTDGAGRVITGIKMWFDPHSGALRTRFRH